VLVVFEEEDDEENPDDRAVVLGVIDWNGCKPAIPLDMFKPTNPIKVVHAAFKVGVHGTCFVLLLLLQRSNAYNMEDAMGAKYCRVMPG